MNPIDEQLSKDAAPQTHEREYDHVKTTGSHYTPVELARFLAARALESIGRNRDLRVLDPACGDGNLLVAVAEQLPKRARRKVTFFGLEQDRAAAQMARDRLRDIDTGLAVEIHEADFIDEIVATTGSQAGLFPSTSNVPVLHEDFDLVIANPPYVRTQVLGAQKAQALARSLGLSGRVDLYHAFVQAMTLSLRVGGTLALLCSNRFLSTLSGQSVRRILASEFDLAHIFDLGDTKLFGAAVLPAIVIGVRAQSPSASKCQFAKVYEMRSVEESTAKRFPDVLKALEEGADGPVRVNGSAYTVERGTLAAHSDESRPWTLASSITEAWLAQVMAKSQGTFEDVSQIRVGIKTTADKVFIRKDWNALPSEQLPEPELLYPLITHHVADRWVPAPPEAEVVYPHEKPPGSRKRAIDLKGFPRAAAYFESNRERLEGRKYVIEAGRKWYEIWVPQQPEAWALPKVVFPDISEEPRFFIDDTGAIVNGDCYWLTLKPGVSPSTLFLILAVANSTLAVKFYDMVCGNKLYAGRRRFITQYVKRFPVPDPASREGTAIIEKCQVLLDAKTRGASTEEQEKELDELVWQSFGFGEEVCR